MGRAWRKQAKIERRLGEDWRRPKGVHHRTHERLLEQIAECEEKRDLALAGRLGTLLARYPYLRDDPLFRA